MKRFSCLVLVALVLTGLSACGGDGSNVSSIESKYKEKCEYRTYEELLDTNNDFVAIEGKCYKVESTGDDSYLLQMTENEDVRTWIPIITDEVLKEGEKIAVWGERDGGVMNEDSDDDTILPIIRAKYIDIIK